MRGTIRGGSGYILAVLVALCATMEGCVGCCTPSIYHGPASGLDVRITVLDLDEKPGDGKVLTVVQFLFSGNPVQIDPGITVQCNGITMSWYGSFYGHAERIPQQPAKGSYAITYKDAGIISTARVTVPERPVFAAPTIAGATLSRSDKFTIRYVAGSGNTVLGRASDASRNVSNSQVDDGSLDGLDVSGFDPGPGKLSITRTQEWSVDDTGFHSVDATFSMNRQVPVTWRQ